MPGLCWEFESPSVGHCWAGDCSSPNNLWFLPGLNKGLSLSRDKTTNTFFLLQSRCPFLSLQNVIQSSWGSSFQSGQHLETLFDRPVGYDLASFYLTIVFLNCISVLCKKCKCLRYFSKHGATNCAWLDGGCIMASKVHIFSILLYLFSVLCAWLTSQWIMSSCQFLFLIDSLKPWCHLDMQSAVEKCANWFDFFKTFGTYS